MVEVYRQENMPLRSWIETDILYIHADDVPTYKKKGSIVRNSFFWALRSIAVQSPMGKAWEFETAVWFALQRMLTNFTDSGYLGTRETQLEFREDAVIPKLLQTMGTWIPAAEFDDELDSKQHQYFDNGCEETGCEETDGDSTEVGPLNRARTRRRKPSSLQRKAKQRPQPEERPSPPYSSYIKKQP